MAKSKAPQGASETEKKLVPLDQVFEECGRSYAAAARKVGIDRAQLVRWLKRENYADLGHRELLALKGYSAPERPIK